MADETIKHNAIDGVTFIPNVIHETISGKTNRLVEPVR